MNVNLNGIWNFTNVFQYKRLNTRFDFPFCWFWGFCNHRNLFLFWAEVSWISLIGINKRVLFILAIARTIWHITFRLVTVTWMAGRGYFNKSTLSTKRERLNSLKWPINGKITDDGKWSMLYSNRNGQFLVQKNWCDLNEVCFDPACI